MEHKGTQHRKNVQSGDTIKIQIHEHGNFVSVTHTDDFIKHFPGIDFTTFHNRK